MIPALTLGNAVAFVVALIGVAFLTNGLRHAFIDEVGIGGILIVVAWGITTLNGPII